MQHSKYPAIYEKIDPIKNEVRLLKLLPSTDREAPIYCDLFRHHLDSDSDYTSLSYCWGPLDPSQLITLQGQDFSITPNLHAALKQIRSTDTVKIIWIDALCIDQSNAAEKGHQVAQMGAIYSNATCTIMWLGTETKDCDLAKKLTEEFRKLGTMLFSPTKEGAEGQSDIVLDIFASDAYDPHWAALNVLLSVDYWRRAWIVQEMVLSERLFFMCGSIEIGWRELQLISMFMEGTPRLEAHGGINYQRNASVSKILMSTVRELDSMRKAGKNEKAAALVQGLFISGLRCATDHRDHVYSILGIVQDSYGIVPNYELCAECVYVDAIERVITRDKSLDILSLCKGFSTKKRTEMKRFQNKLGCCIDWVQNGASPVSNPSIMWRASAENGDKYDNEMGCTGWPESVRCLCGFQTTEMWQKINTVMPDVHPGSYVGNRSWMPNWPCRFDETSELSQKSRYKLLYQGEQCHFRASGASEATFQFSASKEYLTVSGFIFDQVNYVTGPQGSRESWESWEPRDRFAGHARHNFIFPQIWYELKQMDPNFYGNDSARRFDALIKSLASGRGVNGGKLTEMDILTLHCGVHTTMEGMSDGSKLPNIEKPNFSWSYFTQLVRRNHFSEMIITSKGAIGVTEKEVQEGDLVCILFGARIPFILRPDKDKYFLIGEAYIDGIMEGELMKDFEEGKYEKMDFCLQ